MIFSFGKNGEKNLILFFGTSLVAVTTNRFLYVVLFLIITHVFYGAILWRSTHGIEVSFIFGFLIDLCAGVFFYLYTKWWLAKKPEAQAKKIKSRITKWLSGLLGISLIVATILIYLAIERSKELIAEAKKQAQKQERVIETAPTSETTGFGIIQDPMFWNSESGKPTARNSP